MLFAQLVVASIHDCKAGHPAPFQKPITAFANDPLPPVHFVPQSPQAGEIVNFLLADGAPVEYLQEVVELAPFFGGHIIGDSKYA
jgi:hypothetical protein